jgi:hypothetical protein
VDLRLLHSERNTNLEVLRDLQNAMSSPHDGPHYSEVGGRGLAREVVEELQDGMVVALVA